MMTSDQRDEIRTTIEFAKLEYEKGNVYNVKRQWLQTYITDTVLLLDEVLRLALENEQLKADLEFYKKGTL